MPLDKINTTRYHSDKAQAERAAREQLKIILEAKNRKYFDKVRGGGKYLSAASSMAKQAEPFTPNQLSYIDAIMEKLWEGAGYDSFKATYKPDTRKMLRYGGRK